MTLVEKLNEITAPGQVKLDEAFAAWPVTDWPVDGLATVRGVATWEARHAIAEQLDEYGR